MALAGFNLNHVAFFEPQGYMLYAVSTAVGRLVSKIHTRCPAPVRRHKKLKTGDIVAGDADPAPFLAGSDGQVHVFRLF